MKKIALLSIVLISFSTTFAQVSQRVLLEHFTNTRCSACGSRNPGLKTNLGNNPSVISMSVHPSSPYSSCLLHQHNSTDNDERTRYYSIYGSTPRIVINGAPVNVNFSSSTLFTAYQGKMTELDVTCGIRTNSANQIEVKVDVETKASHNYGGEKLFVALVEDTVFYNAPNGETFHVNVLREALTDPRGDAFVPKSTVGQIESKTFTVNVNSEWNVSRMKVIAIVQKTVDRSTIQAGESDALGNNSGTVGVRNISNSEVMIYPNPSTGIVHVDGLENGSYQLLNVSGQVVSSGAISGNQSLNFEQLSFGIYSLVLSSEQGTSLHKVVLH